MNVIRDSNRTAVVLILMVALTGCSEQATKTTRTEVPSVAAASHERGRVDPPKLWTDGPAAEMVKALLGYHQPGDTVNVVRWENGDIEGWVDLDQGEGTKRTPLDSPRADIVESLKKAPGTTTTSGWIVVAMQHQPDKDPAEYRCRVVGEATSMKQQDSESVGAHYRFATAEGRLVLQPPEVSAGMAEFTPESFTMPRVVSGTAGKNWLEVRLKKSPQLP